MKYMYRKFFKRFLDILFALICLPILGLITVLITPIIKYCDHGPVFYNALRLGRNGKVFTMYKLRSMKVNAPDMRNPDGSTMNAADDPRQTKIGKLLRKTSIDELPQVINVLKGEMSFVGPRPDLPGADKTVYRPGDFDKLTVLPGITGYCQALYRNTSTLEQRFDGDVFYAKNVSFRLDCRIIAKTLQTVLAQRNVYRNC